MISDCCGASPDGIEWCEDVCICPDCKEHCEWVDETEDENETKSPEVVIDIVLRRTNRKWLGIVQIDGREVYRTWNYHDTKEGALERADEWFKESMQGGNLEALFNQILGTSNPGVHPSDGASPAVSGATRCSRPE